MVLCFMLRRKYFGVVAFTIGMTIFFLSSDFRITGNAILSNGFGSSLSIFVSVMFLAAAMILMTGKVSLDAILIPCSNEEGLTRKRAKRAVKAHTEYPGALIVASGGDTPGLNPNYSSEAHIAYEELRKAGIKPKYMKMETHSKDSIDNIKLSLKKIPGARKLGIVSNVHQIERLEKIIEKGKEEGAIPKDLQVYGIKTHESLKERIYEFPASLLTDHILKTRGYSGKGLPEGKFKKAINYLLKLGKSD